MNKAEFLKMLARAANDGLSAFYDASSDDIIKGARGLMDDDPRHVTPELFDMVERTGKFQNGGREAALDAAFGVPGVDFTPDNAARFDEWTDWSHYTRADGGFSYPKPDLGGDSQAFDTMGLHAGTKWAAKSRENSVKAGMGTKPDAQRGAFYQLRADTSRPFLPEHVPAFTASLPDPDELIRRAERSRPDTAANPIWRQALIRSYGAMQDAAKPASDPQVAGPAQLGPLASDPNLQNLRARLFGTKPAPMPPPAPDRWYERPNSPLDDYLEETMDYLARGGPDLDGGMPFTRAGLVRRRMAEQGFTHIPYRNDVEDAGSTSIVALTDRPGQPGVVRRREARFQPQLRHLPNLLAGLAGAAYLPGILAEESWNGR